MIEALQFGFMRHALLAGLLVSIACGIIGAYVVVNRIVFISGGIAHAAYGGIGLAFSTNHGRFHEFIVFITCVCGFQGFNGRRELELTFCQGHQVIGLFNAIPAVVAVHGVVTTNDGGDAAFAQCGKFLFEGLQRAFCAAWWRIATIQEGVQIDFFRTAFSGQLNHRHDVIFVAVNAAGREQAHNVNGLASGNGFINRA